MARRESPREDLIRDGTAMVDRVELVAAGKTPVVVGFRKDGSVSLYFGEDPVYQFNPAGELRRAYVEGMIKAESGQLVRLEKHRADHEVQLLRHVLTPDAQTRFLETVLLQLRDLRKSLEDGERRVGRQVSATGRDVLPRVVDWLDQVPDRLQVASRL